MIKLDAQSVADALPYEALIDALDDAFRSDIEVPQRAHHSVQVPGKHTATLLLMPAWRAGAALGVKIATVFPDNSQQALPAVHASYLLMDATTGVPQAILDGTELTLRRTACASALASRYLSRDDSQRLLMVGTGNLAPHLISAHTCVRPIESVRVWGRRPDAAADVVARFTDAGFSIGVDAELADAVQQADIVSCATLASEPLVRGRWLKPGQHLDLVGAFTPNMREADADAVQRAELYVDTRAGALTEAGEIVQALKEGVIDESDIVGELADLARAECAGRSAEDSITMFKSVGTALEDLTAAELAVANVSAL